jgi:hypothetical protein
MGCRTPQSFFGSGSNSLRNHKIFWSDHGLRHSMKPPRAYARGIFHFFGEIRRSTLLAYSAEAAASAAKAGRSSPCGPKPSGDGSSFGLRRPKSATADEGRRVRPRLPGGGQASHSSTALAYSAEVASATKAGRPWSSAKADKIFPLYLNFYDPVSLEFSLYRVKAD